MNEGAKHEQSCLLKLQNRRWLWGALLRCVPTLESAARHTHTRFGKFPFLPQRFEQAYVDIARPLPPYRGYTHLLSSVDRLSRLPEFVFMENIAVETITRAFLFILISSFGVPSIATKNKRRQFEYSFFLHVSSLLEGPQNSQLCLKFYR